ncbi:hypothetical protein ACX80D_01680 [Arthrobacter sp. Sr24]
MMSFWVFVVAIGLLGVAGLVYFSVKRGKGPEATESTEALKVAKITRIVALLYVAGCTLGGLLQAATTLWGPNVTVDLPVEQFWPVLPENADIQTPLASVVDGGFTQATVSVDGLDIFARLWLAGAVLLEAAMAVMVGLIIARMCVALIHQTLFGTKLVRGMRQVAGVVLLGGVLGQICQLVGGTLASHQVLGATVWELSSETIAWTDIHNIVGMPSVAYHWEFNFWPIGIALALMVVAELFRQGSKVQKDAAGLI